MTPEEEREEEVYLNMDDYDITIGDNVIGRMFAFIIEKQKLIRLSEIRIFDEHKRKGYGTEAMNKLVDFADSNGYTISLTPSSSYGTSKSVLKKWYESLGFIYNKGRDKNFEISDLMYRLPKSSEKELEEEKKKKKKRKKKKKNSTPVMKYPSGVIFSFGAM